jgi:hypothetical protein
VQQQGHDRPENLTRQAMVHARSTREHMFATRFWRGRGSGTRRSFTKYRDAVPGQSMPVRREQLIELREEVLAARQLLERLGTDLRTVAARAPRQAQPR